VVIQVPGYIIKGEIGVGGMATVYLAIQTSLEREVALKVMTQALVSDPNFSRRFLMEARTLASLSHPNIVSVYDVGVTDAQLHYFSMQHLPGGDFVRRVRNGVEQGEVLRVLIGVGRALAFAHLRGFVHRDVSPANILFDASDNPVLTDFGIARAVTRTSRLTNAGVSVGTSHYMSPEQARGGGVDARSDLYSLGAVAYEGLTGQPPFDGEDGFAIAYAHVFEPVPRLPAALAVWQPFIDRALAKDPAQRFADADAMLVELERIGHAAGLLGSAARMQTLSMPIPAALQSASTAPVSVVSTLQMPAIPAPAAPAPARAPGVVPEPVVEPAETSADTVPPASGRALRFWAPVAAIAGLVLIVTAVVLLLVSRRDPEVTQPVAVASPAPEPASMLETPAQPVAAPPEPSVIEPAPDPGLSASDAQALPDADPLAEQRAIDTTVADPFERLMWLGRADLAAQRLAVPPGRNALERYRLARQLAERWRDDAAATRARDGIIEVASAYVELGEKALAQKQLSEFLDYLGRAEQIAGEVENGAELTRRVVARRAGLRDSALAEGERALDAWDRRAALANFERARQIDAGSRAAERGIARARAMGAAGYVFTDPIAAGGRGPELLIVAVGSGAVALARNEVTLAEFRAYWQAEGRARRGADRPACRDRESFFRSSRKRSFETPDIAQDGAHPVVCVTWADAGDYARWLSERTGQRYRLPTQAEWRAALGGGSASDTCRANRADASYGRQFRERDVAACDDAHAATAPVRSFPASGGLFDLDGNVREWLGDCAPGCREYLAAGLAWSDAPGVERGRSEGYGRDLASNTIGFRLARELGTERR
jgi:hypothetical protein